jgi:transitional endoplasmic reticulum ATPase
LIDAAILRSGRFDFVLEFPLPDEEARRAIFAAHTNGKPLAVDVDLGVLAQQTEGMTGSDIAAICQGGSMVAIKEAVKAGSKDHKLQISRKHFDFAIRSSRASKGGGE